MSRAEELREAIDNLCFSRKYYFGVLTEMEQTGFGYGPKYKQVENTIQTITRNIYRLSEELEKVEAREYEAEQFCFFEKNIQRGEIRV